MKIWLRTTTETSFSSGIGVVWNSVKNAFDKLGINYTLDDPKEKCIELWIGWDFDIEPSSNFVIGYTTGETAIEEMKCYEQVDLWFFPTKYFVDLQSGKYNIHQWKYGADPVMLPYIYRNWDDVFVFSHVGATQYRKGTHLACQAFRNVFGDSKGVRLDIISHGETEAFWMLQELYECDNIRFIASNIPREDIKTKYGGNCLLFPSLREGWGLHLGEAMATGMPAIVTDYRIFDDQFNSNFGWWIKLSDKKSKIFKELPDMLDFQAKMVYAVKNRGLAKEKGVVASSWCHKYLTWEYGVLNGLIPVLEKYGLGKEIFISRDET